MIANPEIPAYRYNARLDAHTSINMDELDREHCFFFFLYPHNSVPSDVSI